MWLSLVAAAWAWDPDAGRIPSFTEGATASASSTAEDAAQIIDGDQQTHWQSGSCFPTGWLSRAELNLLLGACAAGACSGTASGDLSSATDADGYTNLSVPLSGGQALLRVDLDPSMAEQLLIRGRFGAELVVHGLSGGARVELLRLDSSHSWTWQEATLDSSVWEALEIESTAAFLLTDVGLYLGPCLERATVDLGAPVEVGWIRTRHWAGGSALSTALLGSEDGLSWTTLSSLDPEALAAVDTRLEEPQMLRYLAVEHEVEPTDWAKVYVWEIAAWGADGPAGPLPEPSPSAVSMGELVGVNGIWGWGHDSYSDELGASEGPGLYATVARSARNYHNLHWDITDPDHRPDYSDMASSGTEAMWWLDWDREYGAWAAAGLDVHVSVQFTDATAPLETWDDPYAAAYGYAEAFTRHFGPTSGNGLVRSIEAGNEPWDYPASFYQELLEGFVAGAEAGDPAVTVLPAAFQALDPGTETETSGEYIGARVTEVAGAGLDALNIHAYSYMVDSAGERIAVWPEHPVSGMRNILAMIRWRDANLPGRALWLTEWGWDSEGAGQDCNDGECVSEQAQALYALRGALFAARLGMDRAHWFFYANLDACDTLYCRSGLVASPAAGFAPKASLLALQSLRRHVGEARFLGLLQEDEEAWVYLLGPAGGPPSHVVAWRPIDGGDGALTEVELELPAAPTEARRLSGRSAEGEVEALPEAAGPAWRLALGAAPLLLSFGSEAEDSGAADGGGEDSPPDTASSDGGGGSAGDGLDTSAQGGAGGEEEAPQAKAPPAGCGCATPAGTPGLWALALIGLRRRR